MSNIVSDQPTIKLSNLNNQKSADYSYNRNKSYRESARNREKLARHASEQIKKDRTAYNQFQHSVPLAGSTLEDLQNQRREAYTKEGRKLSLKKETSTKSSSSINKSFDSSTEKIDKKSVTSSSSKNATFTNLDTFGGLESKPGVPYEGIKPFIKSFDLIGFHGGDGVSNFIDKVQTKMAGHVITGKVITHVGVAIRAEDFPVDHYLYKPEYEQQIYVWESTMSGPLAFDGVRNIDGGKCQFCKVCDCFGFTSCMPNVPHRFGFLGTQFRDLDNLTIRYDANPGAVLVWGRLNEENRKKADAMLPSLSELMDTWNGISYNSTCCCIDLCAAALPFFRKVQDFYNKVFCLEKTNGSQFCSEFVANLYKELNILQRNIEANKVVPADYLTRIDDHHLEKLTNTHGKSALKNAGYDDLLDMLKPIFKENNNETNFYDVVKAVDRDDAVPILFSSYIRFSARSFLGKKIYLKPEFLDNLKPVPNFVDERTINHTCTLDEHAQRKKENEDFEKHLQQRLAAQGVNTSSATKISPLIQIFDEEYLSNFETKRRKPCDAGYPEDIEQPDFVIEEIAEISTCGYPEIDDQGFAVFKNE